MQPTVARPEEILKGCRRSNVVLAPLLLVVLGCVQRTCEGIQRDKSKRAARGVATPL